MSYAASVKKKLKKGDLVYVPDMDLLGNVTDFNVISADRVDIYVLNTGYFSRHGSWINAKKIKLVTLEDL